MIRTRCFTHCLLIAALLTLPAYGASLDDFASGSFDARQTALDGFVEQGGDAIATLTGGLADKRVLVRMYSAKALGMIGDASAAPALIKAAKLKTNTPAIRAEAAFALGTMQTIAVAQELLAICGAIGDKADADRYVRLSAAHALCRFRKLKTIPAMIALLKHPDDGIPPVAAVALAELTYFDFGPNYKKWKQWWRDNKDTFKITKPAYPYTPQDD